MNVPSQVLEEDDTNKDGFLSYSEFVAGRRRALGDIIDSELWTMAEWRNEDWTLAQNTKDYEYFLFLAVTLHFFAQNCLECVQCVCGSLLCPLAKVCNFVQGVPKKSLINVFWHKMTKVQ